MTISLQKALETNQLGRFIDEAEADGLGGTVDAVIDDAKAIAAANRKRPPAKPQTPSR